MPEGVGYSSNTIAGIGPDISYVGERSFAYSGKVGIVQSNVTMLEFTTSNSTTVAYFRFNYAVASDDDLRFTVKFNGLDVQGYEMGSSNNHAFQEPLKLIIPPLTSVLCIGYNESSSTSRDAYASMTGRIYK